jgi:NADH pyrophosphatase NudC (nudix superfamily)
MKFCTHCGATLVLKEIEHRLHACCPNCGRIHYEQLKVGAGALIEQDGRLLLLRRTHEPFASDNIPTNLTGTGHIPAIRDWQKLQ